MKLSKFSGGAPISMLEYAKIFRGEGDSVKIIGEFSFNEKKFQDEKFDTYSLREFNSKTPIQNIKSLRQLIKLIEHDRPDLLVMCTIQDCIYGSLLQNLISVPILCIIPGGEVPTYTPKHLERLNMIVFSEENKNALKYLGLNTSLITVLPNRFKFNDANLKSIKDVDSSDCNVLLISRLDNSKKHSIFYSMDLIKQLNVESSSNSVVMRILGDGEIADEVKSYANQINNGCNKKIIFIEGYRDDVINYINNSHIILGKGRCIIDSLYYGRYALVVNEEKKYKICNEVSYEQLRENNFSGRGLLNPDNLSDLKGIISDINMGNYDNKELENLSLKINRDYSIDTAINSILTKRKVAQEERVINTSKLNFVLQFIQFYAKILKSKIQ